MRHRGAWARAILATGAALAGLAPVIAALMTGCDTGGPGVSAQRANVYPPAPQPPHVVALGSVRGAPPPSNSEVQLSLILFGAVPAPPLTIVNPTGMASHEGCVLVADSTLNALFRWDVAVDQVSEESYDPPLEHPFAVDIGSAGERYICDNHGVHRFDAAGREQMSYRREGPFKPAGVLVVGSTVWVSNHAAHCIEVFDAAGGQHIRTFGGYGQGPGEFNLPRGLARMPSGNVCVVDMLNNRVQVLDPDGKWVATLGGPGDVAGTFGRPKDVAVGPDGTVFVTDAFAQRVHVFGPEGQALLAFGEPHSGIGELTMPNGVAITTVRPPMAAALATDQPAAYFVLVTEQLNNPGVRVYARLGRHEAALEAPPTLSSSNWAPPDPELAVGSPHWDAQGCTSCHRQVRGEIQAITPEQIDPLCLSCHDGLRAPADPHPIGRPANTQFITSPADWPTVNGNISCLTCHDIPQHCEPGALRPVVNPHMLRGFDPRQPLEYCSTCHRSDVGQRFSPHRQRDATGRVREDACLFCHTSAPPIPEDGHRRFEPHLRVESSALCMNCHSPHWDLSPKGHVDRPVPPQVRQWMLVRELSRTSTGTPEQLSRLAQSLGRPPALLPLGDGKVTCFTCHNPHYNGLFPEDSELGALAENPADRRAALRTDWIDLCSECHHH